LSLENAKNLAETIAFALAGAFFLYKFISGYLIVNLSIEIDCDRHPTKNSDKDLLAITVLLSKGERGSLDFHDASVQVSYEDGTEEIPLHGIKRSSYIARNDVTSRFKKIKWGRKSKKSPFLRLTPGEKTQLAAKCIVPKAK